MIPGMPAIPVPGGTGQIFAGVRYRESRLAEGLAQDGIAPAKFRIIVYIKCLHLLLWRNAPWLKL